CDFHFLVYSSHVEATRRPLWVGHRNSEPRSDNEDDTLVGTPTPNLRSTPPGGRLTHDVVFSVHHDHMYVGSSLKSGFELEPSGHEAETTTKPPPA
ncbi:hypothetical protein AVEN_241709-1, partial [Araneus ventricosus]